MHRARGYGLHRGWPGSRPGDRKSTRLNSSHSQISYAVFCLKKNTRLNSSHSQISYAVFCLKKKTNIKPTHTEMQLLVHIQLSILRWLTRHHERSVDILHMS